MDKPWLSKTAADMDSGQHIDPKLAQTTFREYAERWLKAQTSDPTSRESVNSQIRLHALPYLGPRPLGSFKPEHIREWLASRLPRTGASSSPASQRSSTPPSMTSTCARTLAARAPCARRPATLRRLRPGHRNESSPRRPLCLSSTAPWWTSVRGAVPARVRPSDWQRRRSDSARAGCTSDAESRW
ncbi:MULTISPECIES: N-terminal phage integrase SAM-like domain-containing protein [unclassified Streptomyces]|uniref:N-terminal phage integrase SAM-like domain-containing protein n=2 Tax=unclassified Streptomyces TaxID=2593676 RepID=UPI002B1CC6A7|nr:MULTISPECIES: N-terminal phage integrase SAM-like domain-containing protein [unclassified Streptomyces]